MPPTWTLCPPRDWPYRSQMSWSDIIVEFGCILAGGAGMLTLALIVVVL